MKITNTTKTEIGLQPEMIVPAVSSAEVDSKAFDKIKDLPSVKAHFDEGRLAHTGGTVSGPAQKYESPADPDRAAIIAGTIRGLDKDADFTKGGKPEVDAINAAMVKGAEPVTAAERDAVWESMSA